MTDIIPFDQIRDTALARADHLLAEWFPHGKRIGREFRIGNISGDPGDSLSVSLTTGKWSDFAATITGYDLIDLCAAKFHGGDRVEAARALGGTLGITVNGHGAGRPAEQRRTEPDWQPMIPPPADAGRPSKEMFKGFDAVYEYTGSNDRVTHYVGRIEARPPRDKIFVPIVYGTLNGTRGWHKKHPAAPKPLYGLNRMSSAPNATVLLCEGEKSADAAQQMFPDHACISWCGGTASVDHADFGPLENRDVIVWPDADPAGALAARKVQQRLPRARVLRVDDLPLKADAADVSPDDPGTWLLARLPPDPMAGLRDFLSIQAWADRDLPEPDRLLGDMVTTTSRMFLVGRTGLGKTLLGFSMATGMANGEGFLHWRAARPARVLYIDGEMSADLIKLRSIDALRRADMPPAPGMLTIYSRDGEDDFAARFPTLGRLEPLNTEAGQNFVMRLIGALGGVDAVVFDNVMSLISGDQKDEIPWSETLPLVARLTAQRVGQIWLDHTGHNTDRQYGSATKAWRFDAVGLMAPLTEEERKPGETAFTLSFEHPGKARRRTPANWDDFETRVIRLFEDRWTVEGTPDTAAKQAKPLAPKAQAVLTALRTIAAGSAMPGAITRDELHAECARVSLLDAILPADTHRQREQKRAGLRKYLAELRVAGHIEVDGETVRIKAK